MHSLSRKGNGEAAFPASRLIRAGDRRANGDAAKVQATITVWFILGWMHHVARVPFPRLRTGRIGWNKRRPWRLRRRCLVVVNR